MSTVWLRFLYVTVLFFQTVNANPITPAEKSAANANSDEQQQNTVSRSIERDSLVNTVENEENTVPATDHDTSVNTVTSQETTVSATAHSMGSELVEKCVQIGLQMATRSVSEVAKQSANAAIFAAPHVKTALIKTGCALLEGIKFANNYVAKPTYNRWGRRLVAKCARELLRVLDPNWKTSLESAAAEGMIADQQSQREKHQREEAAFTCSSSKIGLTQRGQKSGKGLIIDEQRAKKKLAERRKKQSKQRNGGNGKMKAKMEEEEEREEEEGTDEDE